MLKSIKYEFLRSRIQLLIIVCIYAILEVLFLIGTAASSDGVLILSLFGLGTLTFFCHFYILISGITAYSRDLKEKSGYLVFMTPISTFKVIGAKLLKTLIEYVVFSVVFAGSVILDLTLALHRFSGLTWSELLSQISELFFFESPETLLRLLVNIGALIVVLLVALYTVMTLAYLAISLGATVLQNKRGRGLLSFVIFLALMFVLSFIQNLLPDRTFVNAEPVQVFVGVLPNILVLAAAAVAAFIGTAKLLEKKISL